MHCKAVMESSLPTLSERKLNLRWRDNARDMPLRQAPTIHHVNASRSDRDDASIVEKELRYTTFFPRVRL